MTCWTRGKGRKRKWRVPVTDIDVRGRIECPSKYLHYSSLRWEQPTLERAERDREMKMNRRRNGRESEVEEKGGNGGEM
jgi:hypothetical protein